MLSGRLAALLRIAPPCRTMADIGCDHGHLPAAFVRSGKAQHAVAADISEKSLRKAARHVARCGLADAVLLRLGDGLGVLREGEADLIVLSGLGGLAIARILEEGRSISADARLLISPNNAAQTVRKWLLGCGYALVSEDLVRENGRYYPVILAEKGEELPYTRVECEFGRYLIKSRHPLLKPLVEKRMQDARRMQATALKSQSARAQAALRAATRRIEEYGRLLEWLLK